MNNKIIKMINKGCEQKWLFVPRLHHEDSIKFTEHTHINLCYIL